MNQLEDEIELSPPRMSRWQQMFKRRDQPEVNQADVAVKLDFKYAADLVGSELSHVELEEDDDDDVDPLEKCLETFNKARERMINDVVSTDFVCNEYLDDFDKAPEKLENNLLEDIGTKESIKSWLTVEDQAKRIRMRAKNQKKQPKAPPKSSLPAFSFNHKDDVENTLRIRNKIDPSIDPRLTMELRHEKIAKKRELRRLRSQERQSHNEEPEEKSIARSRKENCRNELMIDSTSLKYEAMVREKREKERRDLERARHEQENILREQREAEQRQKRDAINHFMKKHHMAHKAVVFRGWKFYYQRQMAKKYAHRHQVRLKRAVFAAWESRMLKMKSRQRKAAIMQRWKLLSRMWRCWKKYAVEMVAERENAVILHSLKLERQNNKCAEEYNAFRLLRSHFLVWNLWLGTARELKRAEEAQRLRQQKAQQLLQKRAQRRAAKKAEESKQVEVKKVEKLEVESQPVVVSTPCKAPEKPMIEVTARKVDRRECKMRKRPPETPSVLTSMEERQRRRQEAREALKKKYEEAEMKKEEERQQRECEEEARREKEREDARQRKIEAKRLAQEKEFQAQLRREVRIEQHRLAKIHSARTTALHYGWKPWVRLIKTSRVNHTKAESWNNDTVKYKVLGAWKEFERLCKREKTLEEIRRERETELARQMNVRRQCFAVWVKLQHKLSRRLDRARNFHNLNVLERVLCSWKIFHREKFLEMRRKEKIADRHYGRRQEGKIWIAWVEVIENLKFERQLEREREDAWDDVRSWLKELS